MSGALDVTLKDGVGANLRMGAYLNAEGNLATGSVPLVEGSPVAAENPLPIADPVQRSALGAPSAPPWSGSGDGSMVALLKALYAQLGGVLSSKMRVGSDDVSGTNPLPVAATSDLPTRPNVNISLTQTVVTLTAGVSAQLVAAKSNRRYLGIVNIGTAAASLGVGAAAVLNQGWPLVAADSLGAQGGALLWESNAVPTQAFYAIASAATTIVVLEG